MSRKVRWIYVATWMAVVAGVAAVASGPSAADARSHYYIKPPEGLCEEHCGTYDPDSDCWCVILDDE